MDAIKYSPEEIERRIAAIEFKPQHTTACQKKNGYGRWSAPDKRKTCLGCKISACGVVFETFDRMATGETVEAKAKDTVRGWYRKLNGETTASRTEITPALAVKDYLQFVGEEATKSTTEKYETFLNQFLAWCDGKRIETVRQLDQDYIQEFRNTLDDPEADYKKTNLKENGQRRWTTMSLGTIRRNARILKSLFDRCISRKWMKENPATILRMRRRKAVKKAKDDVKYLTRQQMEDILWAVNQFPKMTEVNKNRLKALILTMRWTGLRISDATVLKAESIKNGVLYKQTKKARTDVQIPLPAELTDVLNKMTPYEGGFLFWNRRKEDAEETTVGNNFGVLLKKVFVLAKIEETDLQLISHRFRNTFAVHLLSKGVPLETVSLMLGHESIGTTADSYAAYAHSYMDRAERLVRKVWDLKEDETLESR